MNSFDLRRLAVGAAQQGLGLIRSLSMPLQGTLRRASVTALALFLANSALAAVGINKSFSPNSVVAGQVSTLTIVLLNPNVSIATSVSVTDTLPNGVVVANPLTIGSNTCGFATGAIVPGTRPIPLTGGTIPGISGGVPGQCLITINVVSALPNTYLNTIAQNAVTSSNGTNPQDAQATLVVSALVNITGAKAFLPTTVHGNGTPSTLTITLTNPNVVPLTLSAAFADALPATLDIAPVPNASTTCVAGTVTTANYVSAASPANVTLAAGAQIPASGACTIKVDVIARTPNTATNAASTNTIAAGTLKTVEGPTSPAISANITVQTGGALTKAFVPTTIPAGGTTPSTLTITVTNFNDSILTPITFTDTLPAGMTVTGVPTTTCSGVLTNTATSITLTGASLAAFSTPTVGNKTCTITLQVFAASTQNNSIAAGTWGGVAYSGTGNVALTVRTIGGSKAFSTAVQNGTTTMTITLQNSAAVPAAITTLTDSIATMGAGFSFAAAPTIGGTCGSVLSTSTATSFVVSGGSIPAAAGPVLGSCTITVGPISISTAATIGNHTNTIAIGGVVTSLASNTSTITGTVAVGRALTTAKAFNPTTVQAGTKSRLTVTLTRAATASDITGISLTDNLTSTMGAGFVVATPPNAATTCPGAAFSPALAGGEASFTVSGGSLANANPPPTNFSCTVSLDVATTGATVGAHTNSLPGANVTTTQGVAVNDATAVLTISNSSVTVNKSFSPTTVAVGGTSTMAIQIRNNNAGAINLTGVGLTDSLPAGMVVANPPAPTTSGCTAAPTVTAVNGAATVTLANGSVNANTICTVNVTVRGNVSGNLINNIPPSSVTSLQGVTNPLQGTATLAATGTIKLNVTKTNGVASLTPGGSTTYTIGVSNAGPNDVAGLVINDPPPAGVTFGAWTCLGAGGATCGSGSGPISDIVTIPNGGSITYTVPATIAPNAVGTVTNTVTAVVPGSVINTGNTTATDSDPLVPVTGLVITKDDGSPTYLPGGNATYVMVLTNGGPSDASNVSITDTLPAGVTQNGPATCTPTGAGAVCGTISNLGTGFSVAGAYVPAGGGASLSYSLPVTFGAGMSAPSITNTVTAVNAASSGPGSTTSASDTNTIVLFAPTLGKAISPASIAAGGTATLTLTLGNPNAGATTLNFAFVDNMPAGVTTTGGNTGTCTGITVTATSITKPSGSILPAGGCTIVVTVTSNTPGTVTNTTSALQSAVGIAPAASAPLTVTASAPTLAKAIAPASIAAGGSATLTLTLGNTNAAGTMLTAPFTDPMPAGVTTNGVNTGTCAGVTVTATQITMASGASLPAGGCTIVVAITSTTPGPVTNTTSALQTGFGAAPAASAPLTVTVVPPTLGKAIAPAAIAAGGSATLTLTLGNPNAIATTLTAAFTDPMPPGVTVTSANTGTCVGVGVTPTLLTLAGGASIPAGGCTIIVTITSTTPGTVTNTTSPLQTDVGAAPAAAAPLTVNAVAATLAKTIVPGVITAGGTSTLTLTLGNANASPQALTANFTDPMPAGITTTSANAGTCAGVSVTPTLITMASGSLIPPGGCTIIVAITSSLPGTVTNTTSTLSTGAGTTPAASAPLTVNEAPLALGKSIAPASIVAGGSATLTIVIGNPNAAGTTLTANFTDPMPAGVTTTSANAGSCTGVSVTPALITMASGSPVPVGGCTIVVTITSSTPGAVTNTTSAIQTAAGSAPAASAPLSVTAATLGLAKTIAPASVAAGGTATLTLTLANANAVAQTLTAPFTDRMPAGVTTASGNTGTCTGVTVTPTLITMAGGTSVPPGGCTIAVTITSTTPGTVTNNTSTIVTGAGTTPAASAPLTVTAAPLALTKAISPATIVSGGSATLTLTIGNVNAVAQTLTAPFTDPMPAGVTTTSGNTGTCTGVTVTPTLITMASGTGIPPGGCTIVVSITSATPGTVTNTTSSLVTGAGTAPPSSAPLTVTPSASVLTKTIVPATITAGGTATLTLTLGNANATPQSLTSAFTDPMPAGVTTTSGNTGTCIGVTVTASLVTMASGSSIPPGGCTIVVTITSTTPGTVTNTTSSLVTAGGTTPPASAPLTVNAGAPTLDKTIVPAAIAAGGTSTLTLTLGNANATPQPLTAAFTDPMPAGMTTTGGNTGTCTGVTVTATLVTMALGSPIPPGGCTIVVAVTSTTPGTVTNTTGTLATAGGTSAPASAPLTVNAIPLTVLKTISPATIAAGGTATLTLALGNANAVVQSLTAPFTDPMPSGVTTTSGNTGTCVGASVTSTLITLPSGAGIPPGGCTIVVTITSNTPGTVTNTTSTVATAAGTGPAASAPLTVTAIAASLGKVMLPTTIVAGDASMLTLTLGNTNATPLPLTSLFSDPMPAGVTTIGGNIGTCPGVTVTAYLITMASGSAIPPGGCTIVVKITSYTSGAVVNTTGTLSTTAGVSAQASAPLVVLSTPPAAIPANSPAGLALLLLSLSALAAWQLSRRRAGVSRHSD